jgi:hypothetical protein
LMAGNVEVAYMKVVRQSGFSSAGRRKRSLTSSSGSSLPLLS